LCRWIVKYDYLREIMKKYFVFAVVLFATTAAFAQKKNPPKSTTTSAQDSVAAAKKATLAAATTPAATSGKKDWSKVNLSRRANDHFMFQFGYDNWAAAPDSIHIQGFNRSANFYFMFDFPFKSDPRLSVGAGVGIGSSNIFFNQQEVLVAAYNNQTLAFPDQEGGNHFKKYKLVTTFLEAPIELRFATDPEHTNSCWKFAIGMKAGLLMSAYTKAKDLQNNVGQTLGSYIEKESSKQFFNSTKLAATARINYGPVGIFGQFQFNSLLKANAGPTIYPFSFGIMVSGL